MSQNLPMTAPPSNSSSHKILLPQASYQPSQRVFGPPPPAPPTPILQNNNNNTPTNKIYCFCCDHRTVLFGMATVDLIIGFIYFLIYLLAYGNKIPFHNIHITRDRIVVDELDDYRGFLTAGLICSTLMNISSLGLLCGVFKGNKKLCCISHVFGWLVFAPSIIIYVLSSEEGEYAEGITLTSVRGEIVFFGLAIIYRMFQACILYQFKVDTQIYPGVVGQNNIQNNQSPQYGPVYPGGYSQPYNNSGEAQPNNTGYPQPYNSGYPQQITLGPPLPLRKGWSKTTIVEKVPPQ